MDRQTDRRTDGQMAHMDSASEATALRRYTNQIIIIIIIIIMMDGQTDGQTDRQTDRWHTWTAPLKLRPYGAIQIRLLLLLLLLL